MSILLIVALGSSLLFQQNVYAGIASGDISEHDQTIISAKKYAKKAYKEYAQQSIENANRVIAALRLACNVFDATGSVDLTREAFAEYLGGEKGFIWVADDGSYALTKELIDEFKAFIKANAGGVHGSNTTYLPYLIKSNSDASLFEKNADMFFASYNDGYLYYRDISNYDDVVSRSGLSDYEYCLVTWRWNGYRLNFEFIHDIDTFGKSYFYFVSNPTWDSNGYSYTNDDDATLYWYNPYSKEGGYVDYANNGLNDHCSNVIFFEDKHVGVNDTRWGSRTLWLKKYDDFTFQALNIIDPKGRGYMMFTSNDSAKAYFNSLTSTASSSGITINNYNQIYKYVNDDDPSGFIVVSPDDDMDVEPTDYTFDTPTEPGDSGGGSDSGGGASTGDSSGIIKAINNLYDMLEQKLDKIISQIRTNNILTGLDLLNDIFNDYIKDFTTATTELGETVKSKFPFCLPFVIVGALALTNKSATVPKFTIPFKYDTIGVNYDIVIDFSDSKWSACRNVIYYFTLFFYMFGLIYLTFKASKVKE